MFTYPVLIVVLLSELCSASKQVVPDYDSTPPPRSNGRKSGHISEFTDPETGLNPFLDLEEGRVGEMGRSIVEEEEKEVLQQSPPDSDLQLIEGGPDDRVRPRLDEGFGRRWEQFNKAQHGIPLSPSSDTTLTEEQQEEESKKYYQFSTSTEGNSRTSPDVSMSTTKDTDLLDYYALTPVEDQSVDVDYSPEYHSVEAETAVIREDSAQPKKVPVSKDVLISAAITGASVAVIALLLAICWWRQKMKRMSNQGNVNITDNNVESIISDKANRNNDLQKKSFSA